MTNEECPVHIGYILGAMARGEAKPFDESDHSAYAGVEGDGYTLEMEDCVVIIDIGPGTYIQVMHQDPDCPDLDCWMIEIGNGDWEKII